MNDRHSNCPHRLYSLVRGGEEGEGRGKGEREGRREEGREKEKWGGREFFPTISIFKYSIFAFIIN